MLSSHQEFRKFPNFIIIGFLLILWNPSFVESYNQTGIKYNIDHINIDEGYEILDRKVDFPTLCQTPLMATYVTSSKESFVYLTNDQLDRLLYDVLKTLKNSDKIHNNGLYNLSIKNFPEVIRLFFESINPKPPYFQLLYGQYLNIKNCKEIIVDKKRTYVPLRALWIVTAKENEYFPASYEELKSRTTTNTIQKMTNPIKMKDCSEEIILTNPLINVLNSREFRKNSWVPALNKYQKDRQACLATPMTQRVCMCTVNANFISWACVDQENNAMYRAIKIKKDKFDTALQYLHIVRDFCDLIKKIIE